MDKKRKVYAPFSLTSEAGVAQTPVEGYIDVNQAVYPIVNTGEVNENGKWVGVKSDDIEFKGFSRDELIANGTAFLTPTGPNAADNFIDMSGFRSLFIAILPTGITGSGDVRVEAVMGPSNSESRFANLTPVNAGNPLRGALANSNAGSMSNLLLDSADGMFADVWNIYYIESNLAGQILLHFKLTTNTGVEAFFEFAYMRLI